MPDIATDPSLTVGDDIVLELAGNAKNARSAKEINQKINDGLNTGVGILALVAGQQKELGPLVDFAKTIRCTARDKTIILKVSLSGEMIDEALKKKKDN